LVFEQIQDHGPVARTGGRGYIYAARSSASPAIRERTIFFHRDEISDAPFFRLALTPTIELWVSGHLDE
jgi:hypothetical protein